MTPNQHLMTYTLNSGIKGTVDLTSKQVQEWIKAYRIGSKFVTVVGKQYFGLNPELVADFKVHNEYSEQREHISMIQPIMEHKAVDLDPLVEAYSQYKTLIQVECKCGASYIEESPHKRTKWSCKECNNIVFLDRKKGMVDTNIGKAWYMTNKYYVERQSN
ncbi:hypothetical protein G9G63_12195 [Paenibacillus sp. EKM202P]|uniref:hypothetical protein n=1 Tax=unclassified Paenibacillus TaxID=185978 RepID=UPI0013EA7993|nr:MULTISPECIES: hypothetical protein [unclassified Paenibacillus]KAF6564084.1 hypothetical protein G9G63_12195 [Paenibacillus sp. EKM202P]KAF6571131.1 hypothetical protein G9G64_07345 [Paenibacillus sp. EKM207P]MCV9950964.1 hypothetical protein [Paenibacillus sp. BT-177]